MSHPDITTQTVRAVLANHIGADRGITVHGLSHALIGYSNEGSERQIRTCIEQLRRDGAHVCAMPGTGYFIAASIDELNRCCSFLIKRVKATVAQVAAMKRVSVPDLHGQLGIPLELPEDA